MSFLNLLLIPVLWAMGLFDDGGGGEGGAGDGGAKPSDSAAKPDAKPDTGAKPDAKADEQLGDGGKAALEAERRRARDEKKRADSAEAELQRMREASQSESEKAVNEAKKAGADEERTRWEARAIRSDAKAALTVAGASDVAVAVAAFLDEHKDLNVNDEGDVEDLAATVESFKTAHPTLFTARVPSGSADQGATPSSDVQVQPGLDRLRRYHETSSVAKS